MNIKFRETAKLLITSNCSVAQTLAPEEKIKMSYNKQHVIFPEMPEQPDMTDMPIIQTQPICSWCPSNEVLLMIIIPVLLLLLAIVGAYTWSRYDYYGMDQVQDGINRIWEQPSLLDRIWEQLAGVKLPWQ